MKFNKFCRRVKSLKQDDYTAIPAARQRELFGFPFLGRTRCMINREFDVIEFESSIHFGMENWYSWVTFEQAFTLLEERKKLTTNVLYHEVGSDYSVCARTVDCVKEFGERLYR